MSGDREEANAELDKLGKEAKRTTKDPNECPASTSSQQTQPMRRSTRTTRLQGNEMVAETSTAPSSAKRKKTSPEPFKNSTLLLKNRKIAENYSNKKVMNWLDGAKGKNDDKDYAPHDDDQSSKSSQCSDILENFNASNVQRKKDRDNLVKGIRSLSPSTSPTKEALKVQLREAQWKLKMLYDDPTEKQKSAKLEAIDELSWDSIQESEDKVEKQDKVEKHKDSGEREDSAKRPSESLKQVSKEKAKKTNNDNSARTNSDSTLGDKNDDSNDCMGLLDDDELHAIKEKQLYGSRPGTIKLSGDIYCQRKVVKSALANSSNVCHIARGLLVGVFKPEALQACTLTGQEWRAAPSPRKSEDVTPLYQPAVDAIIEYAKIAGGQRKWKVSKVDKDIKHSMSCRLGELKRMMKVQGVDIIAKKYL